MKRVLLAALLSSVLVTGVSAETPALPAADAAPPITAPLSAVKDAGGADALETVLAGENTYFLSTLALSRHLHYQNLPLPAAAGGKNALEGIAGILTVDGKKGSVPVLAAGWDRKGEKADAIFGGMFLPGGHTQEAGEKMLAFNVALVNGANIVNDIFLKSITTVDAVSAPGDRLPYNFFTLDMGKVEQLHRVKTMQDTYTFSAHPALVADGWVIPLYVRGTLTHRNGSYRFLLLTGPDSGWTLVDEAAEDILKAYGEPQKK